jgi:hypothetical protein
MFGSCLLSFVLFGCPGTIEDPSIIGGSGGGMAGTGGAGGTGGGSTMGCAMAPMIFTAHGCTGCHGGTGIMTLGAGFDMEKAGWEMALVGMGPKTDAPANNMCKGMNQMYLKAATQPAEGLFLAKLKAGPPCGVQMPQVGQKMTATEVMCIQAWANSIVAGGTGL